MPTTKGAGAALVDYAIGGGGALVYALSQAFTGSGLLGGLAGAALAGSVIKGQRGSTIATVLGFQSILAMFSGGGGGDNGDAGDM